jgi:hypothetical protein
MTLPSLRFAAAAAILCLAASAWAGEGAGPLRGEYRFHGKTLIDPPPGEARDSHLGLVLEGGAARDLYRRLKGRGQRDICLDDGSRSRDTGPAALHRTGRKTRLALRIRDSAGYAHVGA